MKILLDILEYPEYNWKICGDLKVLSLLLKLQLGYTKHMCFFMSMEQSGRQQSLRS